METVGAACLALGCVGSVSGLAFAAHAADPAPPRRLAGATFAAAAGVGALRAPLAGWGGPFAAGLAGALAGGALAGGLLALLASRSVRAATRRLEVASGLGLAALIGGLAGWSLPTDGWPVAAVALGLALVAGALAKGAAWLRWGAMAGWCAALAIATLSIATGSAAERAGLGGLALAGALLAGALVLSAARPRRRALLACAALAASGLAWTMHLAGLDDALILATFSTAAPLAALAGGARRALVPSLSRGLAAGAGALATWSVASSLGWSEEIVAAAALALGSAAVIAVDASTGRRVLLPRRSVHIAPLDVGDHALGRYRLLAPLGQGAFSTTWRAIDEETGAPVAVKALRADRATASAFRAEATALREISHPNVVRLLEVGTYGRETCLVMELVEGGSLAGRIAHRPLNEEELARIGADLLDALGAVHDAGFVHRDVKPSNILLTKDGRAKLADFGIALVGDQEGTLGGEPGAGSIRFMSPEQASGRRLDPTSDLYSAAATLYEAFTGEPYAKARPNESAVELRLRISEGRSLADDLPGGPQLRAWFEKSLAPESSDRYPTAAAMREGLHDAAGQP